MAPQSPITDGGSSVFSTGLPTSVTRTRLRFPLALLSSLALSSLLYSLTSEFIAGDTAAVSRTLDQWWEIALLLGWRTVELATAWNCNYDGVDLVSLTLISRFPYLYLLSRFYNVHAGTIAASLVTDLISVYAPFRLLRPLSWTHEQTLETVSPNRSIVYDIPLRIITSLLAAALHAVVIFSSYSSWLPAHLVTHFDGLQDLSVAYSANLPALFSILLPIGYAVREFIFTPSAASQVSLEDSKLSTFNAETATLWETVVYNFWGYSRRSKVIIGRTATLVLLGGINTWLQCFVTINGVDPIGAAGWAGVWMASSVLTGAAFLWVGNV